MWVDVRACTSAHVPTCVCKVCEIVWVDALLCGCLSVCACMCVRRACVNLRFQCMCVHVRVHNSVSGLSEPFAVPVCQSIEREGNLLPAPL